jgi:predicted heme/steroid binding protein/uncharacterized membrane protein
MEKFDLQSLAQFNGTAGKPVYIAYQGKVFDVSSSKMWMGGLHMKRHAAGGDISASLAAAPHGEEVFTRYPQVGTLTPAIEPLRPMPVFLSSLLHRFPILERHPHPMTVHFPIVFFLAAAFFIFLDLVTDNSSFETSALHCLTGGILFLPVAMLTGFFTWWLNYLAKPMNAVVIKIILSCIVLFFALCVLMWRLADPLVMETSSTARVIYAAAIFAFVPLISVIGWLGAGLTFPLAKK